MNQLVKYILRPLLLMIFVIGLVCFVVPDYMTFIPWSYQGGFVIAAIPAAITLMLDGVISSLMTSLKLKFATGD